VMGLWHAGGAASWQNWVCWGLYHASGVTAYLVWARAKRARGWGSPITRRLRHVLGTPVTLAFVVGSYAFSASAEEGGWAGIRLFAKLFTLDLE